MNEASKTVTHAETMKEIKEIVKHLSLKSLYSLLGCARGLLKSQIKEDQEEK